MPSAGAMPSSTPSSSAFTSGKPLWPRLRDAARAVGFDRDRCCAAGDGLHALGRSVNGDADGHALGEADPGEGRVDIDEQPAALAALSVSNPAGDALDGGHALRCARREAVTASSLWTMPLNDVCRSRPSAVHPA
jgi:hypothetical protein